MQRNATRIGTFRNMGFLNAVNEVSYWLHAYNKLNKVKKRAIVKL